MLVILDSVCVIANKAPNDYIDVAVETIRRAGLTPNFYRGVGLNVRKSNLHKELRNDAYRAKFVVVLIDALDLPADTAHQLDHWAAPELSRFTEDGIDYQCILTSRLEPTVHQQLVADIAGLVVVDSISDFQKRLEGMLKAGRAPQYN